MLLESGVRVSNFRIVFDILLQIQQERMSARFAEGQKLDVKSKLIPAIHLRAELQQSDTGCNMLEYEHWKNLKRLQFIQFCISFRYADIPIFLQT